MSHCAKDGRRVRCKRTGALGRVANAGCPMAHGCRVVFDNGETMIYADLDVFERNAEIL